MAVAETEVAGSATNLVIQTQPSATATAGVPFGQQPAIEVRDRFGNLRAYMVASVGQTIFTVLFPLAQTSTELYVLSAGTAWP